MNHKRTKKGIRPLDFFNGRKEIAENRTEADEAKTPTIQKQRDSELAPEAVPFLRDESNNDDCHATAPSTINLQEIEKIVNTMVTKALNEIRSNAVLGKQKSKFEEEKYGSKHIGIKQYPRLLTFKEGNEPFKETLDRVIEFAEKYRELTGGKKDH
jgi:hypothetical protein